MSLLDERIVYKPFEYPQAYDTGKHNKPTGFTQKYQWLTMLLIGNPI